MQACYPSIHSVERDTKFSVGFSVLLSVRLRIYQPRLYRSARNFARRFGHISDRFSPILVGIAPEMAEFWASTGVMWRDMLLAEALVASKTL